MLPAFVAPASVGPLLGGHQRLADRPPAVEHVRRAGAAGRRARSRARPAQGDRARCGRRWRSPGCWLSGSRCSREPCSASSTATTSATPPSRCCFCCPGRCCSPAPRSSAPGVYAAGRPFTATLAQLLGMAVTVVGCPCSCAAGGSPRRRSSPPPPTRPSSWRASSPTSGCRRRPWRSFVPTPARMRALAPLSAPAPRAQRGAGVCSPLRRLSRYGIVRAMIFASSQSDQLAQYR